MTPNNRQQALVIEGSEVLKNDFGMAPGMYLEVDDKKSYYYLVRQKNFNQWSINILYPSS